MDRKWPMPKIDAAKNLVSQLPAIDGGHHRRRAGKSPSSGSKRRSSSCWPRSTRTRTPAELAALLSMPKPSVTAYVKHLEAAGFVRREIDAGDLHRHRSIVTPAGAKPWRAASHCSRARSARGSAG
jgi:hypothetical protein